MERLRPHEPSTNADPLELGSEALQKLKKVKQSLGTRWSVSPETDARCDEIAEAIKRLAWGPEG